MKNIFILITAIITLGSCSSTKLTGNPINDYLDAVFKDEKNKVIVVDKKISNKKTLGIFRGDFMFNPKNNSYEREGKASTLYNKQDWDTMNKKYSYDSIPEYWREDDFKLADIIIVKNNVFIKNELHKEYDNKEYPVYAFSNPIFYQKSKYILFTVLTSSTTFGAQPTEFVIIMTRDNSKWMVVDKVYRN